MAPCSVLEEIGAAYELIHLPWGEPWPRAYARLHPLSRVPVLEDDDTVIFESAAIVMHLCDRHPGAGLAPAPGTPARAHFYQWLVFFAATLHPATKPWNYPERFTDEAAGEAAVKRASARATDAVLRVVDRHMSSGGWMLGDTYSACDHMLHQHCSWMEESQAGFVTLADYPHLLDFTTRVRERSAGIRAMLERNAQLSDD